MSRVISLEGEWACRLDSARRGVDEGWQHGTVAEHKVRLPGTTLTNEIGPYFSKKQISNLTPITEHVGPAWYWREIELERGDCDQCIQLSLERCCWETSAWLNGEPLGTRDSLVSPHVYDLSPPAKPGTNQLVVMVDNSNVSSPSGNARVAMAEDEELVIEENTETRLKCGGHHTQFLGYAWNGMTGALTLHVRPKVRISTPQVYPNLTQRAITVNCTVSSDLQQSACARLVLNVAGVDTDTVEKTVDMEVEVQPGERQLSVEVELGDEVRLWSDHTPYLYQLRAKLKSDSGEDNHVVEFGMRELSEVDGRMAVNGKPVFLRGMLEKFVHPIAGHPPTETDEWLKILGVTKSHGFNHVRFHSCCPPDAAFAAADRLGMVFNIELPGASGGESSEQESLDYLQAEAFRILDTFGNHPSFCMLTMGNEILEDERHVEDQSRLMERVARCKAHDSRHWYCCTAHAYTPGREDDYYVTAWPNGPTAHDRHMGEPLRGFRWNGGDVVDDSRFNTRPPETASDYRDGIAGMGKPVITHEVGMWAVYPDIDEAPKYSGVLKPFNLDIIREFMEEKGTIGLARDFVKASGQLSLLLYKEEIEAALRTPGLAGFQILGLHDHPPQGTSTVGVITALRKSKGIVSSEAFRQFCSDTVLLARMSKRTYSSDETFTAQIDVAHYGPSPLSDRLVWQLRSADGKTHCGEEHSVDEIQPGGLTRPATISADLSVFPAPGKLRLEVSLEGTEVLNSWDIWVYPLPQHESPAAVTWARGWSPELASAVVAGETAVLELPQEQIPQARRACFTTLLWNPIMKRKHRSQTMGILCDPKHPALSSFPTEYYSNWQWWDVLRPSRVLNLQEMNPRPEPIIRMIDSFIGNDCLGVLFEAKVGKGRLLVTSLDLARDLETRHAARQLRRSLLDYVGSDRFQPTVRVEPRAIDELVEFHQRELPVPTRDEIRATFDQVVDISEASPSTERRAESSGSGPCP